MPCFPLSPTFALSPKGRNERADKQNIALSDSKRRIAAKSARLPPQCHAVPADNERIIRAGKPSRKTTYVLKWAGDAGHEASTSVFPLLIQVHAETLAFLSNAYARDGKYRLYHLGHLVPITGTVLPKHRHKDLWFEVDRLDGKHRWRYVTSEPFSLGKKGIVTVVFHSDRIGRYRVRTSFRGDKDHLCLPPGPTPRSRAESTSQF